MATTIITPLKPGADENAQALYAAYAEAWGDYDKASEGGDEMYYSGLIDAYHHALTLLGAIEPETEEVTS